MYLSIYHDTNKNLAIKQLPKVQGKSALWDTEVQFFHLVLYHYHITEEKQPLTQFKVLEKILC